MLKLKNLKLEHGYHDHSHAGGGGSASINSIRALLIALSLTLIFAFVEALYGWHANSLALMGDAGHMFSDALALGLAAFAAWLSARPPSAKHTYGLGRAEVIGAWLSTLFVAIIAIVIIIEALERFETPKPVAGSTVIIVASIGLVINLLIAWILSRGERNLNVRAAILHVLSDLLGSVAALISGVVIYLTHWLPIDPLLSIVISLLILISSFRLLRETFAVLMEGVPKHLDFNEVGTAIAEIEHVQRVHDLHVWTLATGTIVLTAHIEIDDMKRWDDLLEKIRYLVAERFQIEHITLQPETPQTTVLHHLPCHEPHF